MCSKPIFCSNVAQKGKISSRLLEPQKVSPNAKSCSNVAEHNWNRETPSQRPYNPQQIPSCTPGMLQTKMADDEKTFTFQCVPNKTFPGFESAEVKERFMKW